MISEFGGQGFGVFKPKLAELAVERLSPVADEYARLIADPAEMDRILTKGAERARAVAEPVMKEVKAKVGFWG